MGAVLSSTPVHYIEIPAAVQGNTKKDRKNLQYKKRPEEPVLQTVEKPRDALKGPQALQF
jgi:hypothetical protein